MENDPIMRRYRTIRAEYERVWANASKTIHFATQQIDTANREMLRLQVIEAYKLTDADRVTLWIYDIDEGDFWYKVETGAKTFADVWVILMSELGSPHNPSPVPELYVWRKFKLREAFCTKDGISIASDPRFGFSFEKA